MSRNYFRPIIPLAILLLILIIPVASSAGPSALDTIRARGELLWGSDSEGGAPYVFPDPKDPSKLIGFEKDIADAVAKELGVRARMVQTAWDSLIPALERGDYDMAMNGLEIIPEREKRVLFSRPYYIYTLQLMVRKDDERIKSIKDLSGRKVGTLAGAVAHDVLQKIGGVDIKSYSAAWPYEDLALGRLDAVFLDTPITVYYGRPDTRLKEAGPQEGEGSYGIALRKEDRELKNVIDTVIDRLLRTGETHLRKMGSVGQGPEKALRLQRIARRGRTISERERRRAAPEIPPLPAQRGRDNDISLRYFHGPCHQHRYITCRDTDLWPPSPEAPRDGLCRALPRHAASDPALHHLLRTSQRRNRALTARRGHHRARHELRRL